MTGREEIIVLTVRHRYNQSTVDQCWHWPFVNSLITTDFFMGHSCTTDPIICLISLTTTLWTVNYKNQIFEINWNCMDNYWQCYAMFVTLAECWDKTHFSPEGWLSVYSTLKYRRLDGWFLLLVDHFGSDWNMSTTIGWIAMIIYSDVQGPHES